MRLYAKQISGDVEAAGLETRLREACPARSVGPQPRVLVAWGGRVILTTPTGQNGAGDWLACVLHTVPLAKDHPNHWEADLGCGT